MRRHEVACPLGGGPGGGGRSKCPNDGAAEIAPLHRTWLILFHYFQHCKGVQALPALLDGHHLRSPLAQQLEALW